MNTMGISDLYLSIRLLNIESRRVPMNNIDFNTKVSDFKLVVSKEVQVPPEDIVLMFRGNLLNDETTLGGSGLRRGLTLFVLKKVKKGPDTPAKGNLESDAALVAAFKNAAKNPNYRIALQRLSRPEILEKIMAATPGLREDPIALSFIQDGELLSQMINIQTVRRVMETHPALADAAQYIVTMVHDEAARYGVYQVPATAYSYTLDALSDDDDGSSSQSSDSQPHTRESSFNASITSEQLAYALASAQAMNPQMNSNSDSGPITNEMFSQALGQALTAATADSQSSPESTSQPARPNLPEVTDPSRRLAENLRQMGELGLTNEALNIQALMATDWNIQEAINLVLSGILTDHDEPLE